MQSNGLVRYRVIARTFHNGSLIEPIGDDGMPSYVVDRPGLDGPGSPFRVEPETATSDVSENRPPQSGSDAGSDVAKLEALLAEQSEKLASAEVAISDLQGRLDTERAAHQSQIAELEAMLAAATAPSGQKQPGPAKGK